ncbi:hypothetical protein [Candidatus Clostridium helianthi]|jgi:hypothetical protein|uniref:Uncharacterized protein n=1 Tax=Candidatus Clostridium helianthi TaxID=3381660 RepID=A0ABW8S939_9CLOT
MLEIYEQIKSIDNERERLKFAVILSEKGIVLDPLLCVLNDINWTFYYKLFKEVNRKKARLINELEDNFQYINID